MRHVLAAIGLLAALTAAAPPATPAAAPPAAAPFKSSDAGSAMREIWKTQTAADVAVVQEVWTRTLGFNLPRPFVPAFRSVANGSYLAEFVPDGQSVDNWTRMVTASGSLGAGAAHLSDAELAGALFDRGRCDGWVYRDLGGTADPIVARRTLVIGCGAPGRPGSERAVIAFFRDTENSWTVQYAERGATTATFEARAQASIAALAPFVTCKAGDTRPECSAK